MSAAFPPIAIVGRACLLPGAHTPEELWAAVRDGRDLVSQVPAERWGLEPRLVRAPSPADARDRTWSDRGGYVEGFESVFDPTGFAIPADEIATLDPLFQWTLHTARGALRDAGYGEPLPASGPLRGGLVMGNLSFVSASFARLVEAHWIESQPILGRAFRERVGVEWPHARNRFMSGQPAHVAARALGLRAGALALDAACASSLYAIKLASDRLHDGDADLMVAGAVNCTDDLFIHVGFCALQAMSRTGRSRPFHRQADGLLPAEGAAFVVLKRLDDARRAGDRIHGVIRGVGLSNDGRGAGFLAPSVEGQRRALERAYAMSGLRPADVSLVECHATGTAVGDGVEIKSLGGAYAGLRNVPIGSLKSNLGHLITAAGAAGLIKVLGAFASGLRPPTLHAEDPLPEIEGSPFRLLRAAEPWPSSGPRRAAVSAFGFGGNNAHLLVEEWTGNGAKASRAPRAPRGTIAVVGLGAVVANTTGAGEFARALFAREPRLGALADGSPAGLAHELAFDGMRVRFPPRDLQQTLAQQLLVLKAALEATSETAPLPRDTTAVLVGMECDTAVAGHGVRLRLAQWARAWVGDEARAEAWLPAARDAAGPALDSTGVVGMMPNIVANRVNSQLDLAGPSLTVSAEELSGVAALEVAMRALRAGEIDAAVVGAVDVCAEETHARAAREVLDGERHAPGDAAVVLVLKRLADAERDGDRIHAVLADDEADGIRRHRATTEAAVELGVGTGAMSLAPLFGHAHAASGLVHVAAAVLACRHAARPEESGAQPWLSSRPRRARVTVAALGGASSAVEVRSARPAEPLAPASLPHLRVFSGADRAEVRAALVAGRESNTGPARLVIVAAGAAEYAARAAQAGEVLQSADPWRGPTPGIVFRDRPLGGELAFVFAGPAGAYRGMGRDLLLALPELAEAAARRFDSIEEAASWVYATGGDPTPTEMLWGSSLICQVHAELARSVLGLHPQAAIGFCSGETNALFALGAWNDLDALYREISEARLYTEEIGGAFASVRRAWGERGEVRWVNWRVLAPVEEVRAALEGEARAHLTIVNAPGDCVIGGDAAACQRVVDRVGAERARPLGYDIAVHCPEMAELSDTWRRLHHRPTSAVPGTRFYTHATLGHYAPTADRAADALLGQALGTVDFPRLVENAWRDGVRTFLEMGPRGACSRWIQRTLGDREHVAVSFDLASESPLRQAAHAVAQLVAAGVAVDYGAIERRIARTARPAPPGEAIQGQRYRVHAARPPLPPLPVGPVATAQVQVMAPAPYLPPVEEPGASRGPLVPANVPAVAVAASASAAPPALAMLMAHHQRIAEIHHQFVAQQAELHERFLALRALAPVPSLASAVVSVPRPTFPPRPAAAAMAPSPVIPIAPPAPPVLEIAPEATDLPRGPRFSREDLEQLARGKVSTLLGPLFERQDGFRKQVRMPGPPILLADRVLGIAGEPGSMGKGTIWTETDVAWDSWYVHDGRMPLGLMIEAGQADLLLISWLGIDFLNQGRRVYRLLGCDLTFHGPLPRAGETLRYDIHVDGHARQGDVRLFFFHYDCRVDGELRLSVRGGQAGFFSDEELAASAGVLADIEGTAPEGDRVDPPAVGTIRSRFSREEIEAFAEGRVRDALGPGYERADSHVRTPRVPAGPTLLLGEITHLDPAGGPWKRGYLRAVRAIAPDDWFFTGHFKDDPCMPGTLILDACLQAASFYMAALGLTLDRDGWRFEPIPEETSRLRCRGQVTKHSRELVFEIFVHEVAAGPAPTLYADFLCTVDGLKAFHCRRAGLRLVPDWPLTSRPGLVLGDTPGALVARHDRFRFGYASLLACAWGRPSDAFGAMYEPFDGGRRVPRLPGPPYHFLSRVARIDGAIGVARAGAAVEVEYDVPPDAWYFEQAGQDLTMPWSVMLEVCLQPCGWLASATGIARETEEDLAFRNLDGIATVMAEVRPDAGTLRTRVHLTDLFRSGSTTIVTFDVECRQADAVVCRMKTVFGFFPAAALAQQVGLPTTDEDRAWRDRPSPFAADLRSRPPGDGGGAPRRPDDMLLMLDRVTGYWREAGRAGLGRLRAEKDVRPEDWFFKAHFFQDPVQPGSLGLEAMVQLVQFYAIERGLGKGIAHARFEPIALDRALVWKYRGQVLPQARRIVVEAEVLEVGRDERGAFVVADVWLWADQTRIYSAHDLTVRIVAGAPPADEVVIDPARATWLLDHRPTWTLPSVPLMYLADRMAEAAVRARPGRRVVGLSDMRVSRWVVADRPVRLKTEVEPKDDGSVAVTLLAYREATVRALSRFEPVATGVVRLADAFPAPPRALAALEAARPLPDPYASGALFHGPAFQVLRRAWAGTRGAAALVEAGPSTVPRGLLDPLLLDATIQAIPQGELGSWSAEIPADHLAYPVGIAEASFHAPLPLAGTVRCEVRFDGFADSPRFPAFRAQLLVGDAVLVQLRLIAVLVPGSRIGAAPAARRRAFLERRAFATGVGLSRFEGATTRLRAGEVKAADWLPGSVADLYQAGGELDALTASVAAKDHVAQRAGVHPSRVEVAADAGSARTRALPLMRFPITLSRDGDEVVVEDAGAAELDVTPVGEYWRARFGSGAALPEDLFLGLIARFVRRVRVEDPDAFARIRGQGALFLANHQVGIESILFSAIASALHGGRMAALAKAEHRASWLGTMGTMCATHPQVRDAVDTVFFDRSDEGALLRIVEELKPRLAAGESILVHVEGTRARACRRPVMKMSSVWIDLAVATGAPIVPVRFAGGLPVEEATERFEFPVAYGRQDYFLGRPILAGELEELPFTERRRKILEDINGLGPSAAEEAPHPPDEAFAARTRARAAASRLRTESAALYCTLEELAEPGPEARALMDGSARSAPAWLGRFAAWFYGDRGMDGGSSPSRSRV